MHYPGAGPIPLWVCIACSVWVGILIPSYIKTFGWANFLWFSDLALFMTAAALWLDSRWLFSMAVVSVLLLEILWNFDFFLRLLTGVRTVGLTDYMFDSHHPL